MSRYYSKFNEPISLNDWVGLMADDNYMRVAKDQFEDLYVSTVWLGLDHGFNGKIQIFETMVLKPNFSSIYCERYKSLSEAEEGHTRAVEWTKNYLKTAQAAH